MLTRDSLQLHQLLDSVEDTHEMVVRVAADNDDDVLHAAWTAARDDAHEAWLAWTGAGGADAWAVYVAARDREDAAIAAIRDLAR